MPIYVYREDKNGKIISQVASERSPLRGTPREATMGFHQQILDAYRQVEDSGKWQGPWAKSFVKQVHENALAEKRK